MVKKKIIYIKLAHPSGRITTRKFKSKFKTLSAVQKEFLGTVEHFRTEAYPIAIIK